MAENDIEAPEAEGAEPVGKLVWLIDDEPTTIEIASRKAEKLGRDKFGFESFNQGEAAILEMQRRIEAGESLPQVILLDGDLAQEVVNPKYKTGTEVIREIKKITEEAGITLPEIVVTSSNGFLRDEMMAAGATSYIDKVKLYQYLVGLAEK